MQIFRKHRKSILWALVIFIGAPMLFFGVPTCRNQKQTGPDPIVASVGNVPVPASQYRELLNLAARRATRGAEERPTYAEMVESGLAQNVLDEALDSARLSLIEQKRGFTVTEEYLWGRMKQWDLFQNDEGEYDSSAWNEWVRAQRERGADFNSIYADVTEQVSRNVLLDVVMAPAARVFDADIDRDLEENYTKLKVKYATVAVKVEPTDEELQKQYDENPDSYKYPDKYVAELVRIDLKAPPTSETVALVQQLRDGADFAAMADEHSDLSPTNGGDMGWQFPRENESEYRKPLFDLAVGAISDPVAGPSGYYIYTVEEERMSEETGDREVKSRQIYIKTDLPPEVKQAKQALADAILAAANEEKDLAKALQSTEVAEAKQKLTEVGAASDLTALRTDLFDIDSEVIENIPSAETRTFRNAFRTLNEETPYRKIPAGAGVYVAGAVAGETVPGTVKPFEEVQGKVRDDAIAAFKRTDEYREQVDALAGKIAESGRKPDEIAEAFPEFDGEVKETGEFTKKDYLYQEQVYVGTPEIFEAFRGKELGAVVGPLSGFVGDAYFFQLTGRTEPTEEDKQNWPQEREQMRNRAIQMAQMDLLQDYLADLRTNGMYPAKTNNEVISQILGLGQSDEDETPAEGTEANGAETVETIAGDGPADETPAEAPAEAPAEEAPAES